jgi:hypothetical protein
VRRFAGGFHGGIREDAAPENPLRMHRKPTNA